MQTLFIDTNIVLDLLAEREPFYESAAELFTLGDLKKVKLSVSALTFANTNYILTQEKSINETRIILRKFKIIVNVLACDDKIIELTLNSDFRDFEDGIQYFTAIENRQDVIITRNLKDFRKSIIPVMSAEEFLSAM